MNIFSSHKKTTSRSKVAIIGAGAVGSTVAYTATIKNIAAEIVLIDKDTPKEEGNVMDIDDGLCFVETGCIKGADMSAARDADVIVITAGAAQKPGETRLDLVHKNTAIFKSIFKSIGKIKKSAIIIVVSNPVDVLTHVAQKLSGLPASQVFGTGTSLDTSRLKTQLGHAFGINTKNIHGYVMGEHGDSEFVAWSTVSIGGVPITKVPGFTTKVATEIEESVRHEAYEIINRKGATYFGIAQVVTNMIKAVVFDQHIIVPVSTRVQNYHGVSGVCIGVPAVIGQYGVEKIWPTELSAAEKKKFVKSAELIKTYLG
jgi:L-lactate dehydrogenase